MSLLTDIVRLSLRSSARILTLQNVAERSVYHLFSRMRRDIESQLHQYLDMWDYINLPQADRVRLAHEFPFRGVFAPLIEGMVQDMYRLEQTTLYQIRDEAAVHFADLENVLWQQDSHAVPKGWTKNVLERMDWNRLSAYMGYLHTGADKWLSSWGSEAPAQLGAGIMGGENTSTIVQRITGVNVQTPENRAALGRKVWQGLQVNTKWAIIKTATEARTEGFRQMNDQYDLGIKRIWVAHIDSACPLCLRLHGHIVGVDEEFPWRKADKPQPFEGVLFGPPRHPQCKCSVAPWKDSWGAMGLTTMTPAVMIAEATAELRRRYPHFT